MSPTELIEERVTRAHLARLRKLSGLAMEWEGKRDAGSALVVVLCALGIVSALILGWAL